MNTITATLIVSDSYTTCSHCGKQTQPESQTHDAVSGYDGGKPGCGVTFTFITTDSPLSPYWFNTLRAMRPDLPIVALGTGKPLDLRIDVPELVDGSECGEGCSGHWPMLICNPCGEELRQCRCAQQEEAS